MASTATEHGRDRLLLAAMQLAAEKRGLSDLGVREITRAAELSPGAFYRHFENLEALGVAVIAQVENILQDALASLWQGVSDQKQLARVSLDTYFALAQSHRAAFIVCARERYGPSSALRTAMQNLQQGLAQQLARELARGVLFERVPLATLEAAAIDVIELLNIRMLDYLAAQGQQQKHIQQQAEQFVRRQFAGVWIDAQQPMNAAPGKQKAV